MEAGAPNDKMNILPFLSSFIDAKILFMFPKKISGHAVDSAVIETFPKKNYLVDEKLFFKVVKAGFANKRKQLAGNLSTNLGFQKRS